MGYGGLFQCRVPGFRFQVSGFGVHAQRRRRGAPLPSSLHVAHLKRHSIHSWGTVSWFGGCASCLRCTHATIAVRRALEVEATHSVTGNSFGFACWVSGLEDCRPEPPSPSAVEPIWHTQDSYGQSVALACRQTSANPLSCPLFAPERRGTRKVERLQSGRCGFRENPSRRRPRWRA